jgi:transitional endoplasmic reticulum ATPase
MKNSTGWKTTTTAAGETSMVSEEAAEILEDRCEEHKTKAQKMLRSNPKQAVYHFSKAADIHGRLADEASSSRVATAHRSQAENLRSNAHRVMQSLGMIGDQESSEDARSAPSEAEAEAPRDTEFFDAPPHADLTDVGGMESLKNRLRKDVQQPLEQPEFYQQQGIGIENGVLLHGPPGTGKSHIARCFAGELGYRYAELHASDIASKWVGEAPKNVRKLFEEARQCEPCILFIDEIDALASDRSNGPQKTNTERQLVNELLQQMQQVQGSEVLVIAATNKPGDLDGAITRSQRFNQRFQVGPPDAEARKSIIGVQLDEGGRAVEWNSINWPKLMEWSEGFSAADLTAVVEKAVRASADESTEKGELVPVQYRHLLEAVKETEASLKYWNDSGR